MCIGIGESKVEDEEMEVAQEHILSGYRIWKDSWKWGFTDEELAGVSEEKYIEGFLNDVKELIENKG